MFSQVLYCSRRCPNILVWIGLACSNVCCQVVSVIGFYLTNKCIDLENQFNPAQSCPMSILHSQIRTQTMIRTFSHGCENNLACKWIYDNFPGTLTYILFLENCLKSICMHGCSLIHMERPFFFFDLILLWTCPHGLENNHACKWFSDNFPGTLHM